MEQRRRSRATRRSVWLSPYLLAVALTPAFLQIQYDCETGDTNLSSLEVEVSGFDQIGNFTPTTTQYDVTISGDTVLVRAVTQDPAASVYYQLRQGGALLEAGALGVGGGEVTLGIPLGTAQLKVDVRPPQGGFGFYTVDFVRLPRFACTEQGILDAIAFGGGPHFFGCSGPTTVTTLTEIVIDNDVILDGESNLTIDGNMDHRVMSVETGVTAELAGLTVTGGLIDFEGAQGAGILNSGTLTISNGVIESNGGPRFLLTYAVRGGGIYNAGTLTLNGSTVQRNNASDGCGLHNVGTATLINSDVSQNGNDGSGESHVNDGSGIFNEGGSLTLIGTTVSLNDDATGDAAAIDSVDGTLLLINSVVSDNIISQSAAIWARGTSVATLVNSTVSGHSTQLISEIDWSGTLQLISSTVVGSSSSLGSTMGSWLGGGDLIVAGSIIVGAGLSEPACFPPFSTTSLGGNIESPGDSCGLADPTDLANVTAAELNLGPLADNGGPTLTHALLPGSVAIDRVPAAMCVDENGDPLTSDQRGVARPQGVACDAGAFEWADCSGSVCDDGNDCTADYCDPPDYSWCVNNALPDGTLCGADGFCEAGQCSPAPTWTAPVVVESSEHGLSSPRLSVDTNGVAMAVWMRSDGTRFDLWANRYTPLQGWGTPEMIESSDWSVSSPQVAMDVDGNAVAIWKQYDGVSTSLWANRYTPSEGWGTPEIIENQDQTVYRPNVAVGSNSNAIVVYEQDQGPRRSVWANRYTPSEGWGTPEIIKNSDLQHATYPDVALDPGGNGIAVWRQHDGSTDNLWTNRYTPLQGWGTPEMIGNNTSIPDIAMDLDGNAIVVTSQDDGSTYNLWTNRYTPLQGWGTPEIIENSDWFASASQTAMDSDGDAIVVWQEDDGVSKSLWANRYTQHAGWGTAEPIEDDIFSLYSFQIAVDGNGNAVVLWHEYAGGVPGGHDLRGSRYTPYTGWGAAVQIEPESWIAPDVGVSPQVVLDPDGRATAVWLWGQTSTATELRFSRLE